MYVRMAQVLSSIIMLMSMPASTTASKIVEAVNSRSGSASRDLWVTEGLELAVVLADFCHADVVIRTQDKQRSTVSRAWLMYLLHQAVDVWMRQEFVTHMEVGKKGHPTNKFINDVIIPAVKPMKPVVTRLSLSQGVTHALFLKDLEASSDHTLVPLTLEAFNVGGFADLAFVARVEVLRMVKGPIKQGLATAMKAYRAGERPEAVVERSAPRAVTDLLDADGVKVTEIRDSDNFVNISALFKLSSKALKHYRRAKGKSAFLASFTCASNKSIIDSPADPIHDTVWAHARVAVDIVEWCELKIDLSRLLSHLPDDTTPAIGKTVHDARKSNEELVIYPIFGVDGAKVSERRSSDNYVNATLLAKSMGTTWAVYRALERARIFREDLALELGVDVNTLVEALRSQKCTGTWVHPEVAVHFAVHVSDLDEDSVRTRMYATVEDGEKMIPVRDTETLVHVTDMRVSDGFVNASMLRRTSVKTVCQCSITDFFNSVFGRDLKNELELRNQDATRMTSGLYGGTWIHPLLAKEYALRCGFNIDLHADKMTRTDNLQTVSDIQDADTSQAPPMKAFLQKLCGDDGNLITEIRITDGYINATKMCHSAGPKKKWAHFHSRERMIVL